MNCGQKKRERKTNKLRALQEVDHRQMCSSEAGVYFLKERLEEERRGIERFPNGETKLEEELVPVNVLNYKWLEKIIDNTAHDLQFSIVDLGYIRHPGVK